MKRYVSGLSQASASSAEALPEGLYLVRIERAQYRWHGQKPYYAFVFSVLEPRPLAGNRFPARLYCTPKALWKLNWFLRDFGYDSELLGRNEIDDKNLIESAEFLPHSGIRFPQNPCSTCPYVGLCLGKPALVDASLIRRPGAQDFGVFDELTY